MKPKLTPAQWDFLQQLYFAGEGGTLACESYKPAQKLVSLGLARSSPQKLSSPKLTITEAGRGYVLERGIGLSKAPTP